MLTILTNSIPSCVGAADNNDGTYRIDLLDGTSRLATDTEVLEARRANAIQQIKTLAGEKILARYPLTKQLNMAAMATDLQHRRIIGTFTQTDEAIEVSLQLAWGWILTVRAYSNELEAQAMSNPDLDIAVGWPE